MFFQGRLSEHFNCHLKILKCERKQVNKKSRQVGMEGGRRGAKSLKNDIKSKFE